MRVPYDGVMDRPIFIDIDGTLTDHGLRNGNPIPERIEHVKGLIAEGHDIVIWSGTGTAYAKAFCLRHGIAPMFACGKPELLVDDNPKVRPAKRMPVIHPDDFFK